MNFTKIFKNTKYMLKIIFRHTPAYLFLIIANSIINSLISITISVYLVMQVFNALETGLSFSNVMSIVGLMAILQISNQILQSVFGSRIIPIQKLKLHSKLQSDLFNKATYMDLECYDNPDFYNNFILSLNEIDNRANNVINEFGQLLSRVLSVITISAILFTIEPILILCTILVVILSSLFQRKINKIGFNRNMSMNPHIRKNDYTVRVFYLRDYAKELRISNIRKILFDKFETTTNEMNETILHYNKKFVFINIIKMVVTSSVFDMGVMLLFAFRMMVKGTLTLGGYAAGTNAIWQLRGQLSGLIDSYSSFHDNSQYIERVKEFINYEPRIVSLGSETLTSDFSRDIIFKNLCFSYKSENMVLKDITLKIKAGEKIAIAGLNGAGKTTLIKLLLRLYDPISGNIEINNIDIKNYELESYRKGFGVVFQDYNLYAATLSENVLMDDIADKTAVDYSLLKSGLSKKNVDINSIITREFDDNGVIFSGGESQKVAIARVFAHPFHTLILDEPSSALDPIAEYNFNKILVEASEGKTVIFISHRLSTTKIADRIFMIENGEVIESGTHQELMNKNGKYSVMFNMQAEKYRV